MRVNELFPAEVTTQKPCLTMVGKELLRVEQHKGLIAYQEEHIVLKSQAGRIRIGGRGLSLRLYTPHEALITGEINDVVVEDSTS